jgi:hypothetical protein
VLGIRWSNAYADGLRLKSIPLETRYVDNFPLSVWRNAAYSKNLEDELDTGDEPTLISREQWRDYTLWPPRSLTQCRLLA